MKVFDPKHDRNFVDNPVMGSFIEEPTYDPVIAAEKFKRGIHHGRKHKECDRDEDGEEQTH